MLDDGLEGTPGADGPLFHSPQPPWLSVDRRLSPANCRSSQWCRWAGLSRRPFQPGPRQRWPTAMSKAAPNSLPYQDTKPQGSADFYFAINATFRFILARLGRDSWIHYLEQLGHGYYAPVNRL